MTSASHRVASLFDGNFGRYVCARRHRSGELEVNVHIQDTGTKSAAALWPDITSRYLPANLCSIGDCLQSGNSSGTARSYPAKVSLQLNLTKTFGSKVHSGCQGRQTEILGTGWSHSKVTVPLLNKGGSGAGDSVGRVK
jgi:hypothetical protein